MKKTLIAIAFLIIAVFSFAQNTLGTRMKILEVEEYNNDYSVFTYKDYYGSRDYYLSLGHIYNYMQTSREFMNELVSEICIYLGVTTDEAIDSIGYLLGLFGSEPGTTTMFRCRVATDSDKLSDYKNIKCMVVKRRIQGKCLSFQYETDKGIVETYMTKSSLKMLRKGLKIR